MRINVVLVTGSISFHLLNQVSTEAFSFIPTTSLTFVSNRYSQSSTTIMSVHLRTKSHDGDGKFHFAIDRGGTFTDVHCILPNGQELVTKLLSEDPANYEDAPTEGIRRILAAHDIVHSQAYTRDSKVYTGSIGSIRMGTTVATNALLERKGEPMALFITKGFRDLLKIGNQSRENIFDLTCAAPSLLYECVYEVDERIMLDTFCQSEEYVNNPEVKKIKLENHDDDESLPLASVGSRVLGVTGEKVIILRPPSEKKVKAQLQELMDRGIKSIAVVLAHAYTYDEHEKCILKWAQEMKYFTNISLSSKVMQMVKMVPRGHTACAAAYLTPKILDYLASFQAGFDENLTKNVQLTFMKSDGGLTAFDSFGGHQAILSGPAGGVIGYGKTTYRHFGNVEGEVSDTSHISNGNSLNSNTKIMPVVGFDMGGTSTDVSRYDGHLEHVFETTTAGVSIQAAQLDISTVAAGGGSRLFLRGGLFVVGPESAGAHPGPVCYRKNGFLAVTDANVVLGRLLTDFFPKIFGPTEDQPLDVDGSREAFAALSRHKEANGRSAEELAYGFIQVANEAMCRPIRNLTQMKGYDIRTHRLACFGGAGPQHACAVAKALGMSKVFIHRFGGILSAYGLSMADAVHEEQEPTAQIYEHCDPIRSHDDPSAQSREERFIVLSQAAIAALVKQGYKQDSIVIERYLNLRYQGTDNAIMIREPTLDSARGPLPFADDFRAHYQREFGFVLEGRDILIDDFRVRAVVPGSSPGSVRAVPSLGNAPVHSTTRAYFENGWQEVNVFLTEALLPGHSIVGPAIIVQQISTIVLEIGCTAVVTADGDIDITVGTSSMSTPHHSVLSTDTPTDVTFEIKETPQMKIENADTIIKEDPVQLSIFSHRFMGIAEQMGRTLQRTAISVNMKERLDFSCALFTKDGDLVANAPHIPVHLGAMQAAVKFQVKYWTQEGNGGINEGDVFVSNHPQLAGGSHLPDITVITPVFHKGKIIFFVASRGHHADIGGISPGSMPPHSQTLLDEGAHIVAFKLVRDGHFQEEGITELLMSPGLIPGNSGTRNLSDNLSDLRAQVAANNSGIRLLEELVEEYSLRVVEAYMYFIQNNAEKSVRNMLKEFAERHGSHVEAIDHMDDGTPIKLKIDIDDSTGDAVFDFTGTGPQVLGNHNAPPAVTYSAVIYSLRSLVGQAIPLNQGCLAPITFIIPNYTLLNPSEDAAVVGGNVVTSQRVVDVVLKAFKACAASQGCMNNLTFGDQLFGYYETIAGGAGAGPSWHGRSGVHTHCTNTRITDPEILERRYPVLLREFSLRLGSGGAGKYHGGDGIIREIEPLRKLTMSILSERRTLQPYGMDGGAPGLCGRNLLIKKGGLVVNIGGRCSTSISEGERLRIETPSGGGYGPFIE